jgi:hypothetical protein
MYNVGMGKRSFWFVLGCISTLVVATVVKEIVEEDNEWQNAWEQSASEGFDESSIQ